MFDRAKLTGFADEAGRDLETQIRATRELGWTNISARGISGRNLHDLPEAEFDAAVDQLGEAGIHVCEFGSLIGSWAKTIHSDWDLTLGEVERCIQRAPRLGTSLIRIMSYAQEPWGADQFEAERFRRLREITNRLTDAGLTPVHENCMNWGGFSAAHDLRLVDEVPGLKLLFDTGNPVFQRDRSKPAADGSFPWQDPFEFWQQIRDHVVHIHVKDCLNPVADAVEPIYTMPGDGQARLTEILADAAARGYSGFIAIEPHVATVFHAKQDEVDWDQCYSSFVAYGSRLEDLLRRIG
jgi:sugar phosphate isomerase/epimerase